MEPLSEQEVAVGNSPTTNYDEVRWTDDSIRWKGGLRVGVSSSSSADGVGADDKKPAMAHEKSEDDDEECVIDPFKLVMILCIQLNFCMNTIKLR